MSSRDGETAYMGECYWPGVNSRKFAAAAQRLQEAEKQLRQDGGDVEFLGSVLLVADETVFCLFAGREKDVRALSTRAGVVFERLLPALRIEGQRAGSSRDRQAASSRARAAP